MARYPRARSAILPALHIAQRQIGWLPNEVMDEIARIFDMEPMEVYAIAGFYNMFYKEPKGKFHLEICTNVPCMLRGAGEMADYLQEKLGIGFNETTSDGVFTLDHMECLGSCATAPVMSARRNQSAWARYYEGLSKEKIDAIIAELQTATELPPDHDESGPYHHDHHPQTNFLLARIDKPQSHTMASYLADDGYETARKTLQMAPDEAVGIVKAAGVRGRGGAGFPAGVKWGFLPKDVTPRYLVINADESEPGTFKDRLILQYDPHQLLEGAICTAWAIQAHYAFIYVRGEYAFAQRRLRTAIAEAKAKGFLGQNIFGSDFDLEVIVHSGAGAYICGEETALLSSLEGGRGHPRLKPPFPAVAGLYAKPTIINNVETIAHVRHVMEHGADWYRQWGSERSPGFQLISLSGQVKKPGVYEIPYGTTLRELIYDMAGGTLDDRPIKSIIPGGLSMPHILPDKLDTSIDFESIQAAGSLLGSGGVIVLCEGEDIVPLARRTVSFYREESCGKCSPCREGSGWLEKVLKRIEAGQGVPSDIDRLKHITKYIDQQSFCPFGPASVWGLQSTMRLFGDEFAATIAATNPEAQKPTIPARPTYRQYVGQPLENKLDDED
ncbi:MAG: NADH-quinone oxidoreductase subunit NuoF [Chloroflexi bacterium]|nr:NADH-quinone oxidoreductase subunit NuoF [Chloroflexota bacterium]